MGKNRKKLKIFSALEVANLCGVVNQTAINWIKNGYLEAFTTPGGQYRVYAETLIEFMESRGMLLPEELVPYKTDTNKPVKILVIDSEISFGNLIIEKASVEKKDYDIKISTDNFSAGYLCAKMLPDIIIIKNSCKYTGVEELKSFFEREKVPEAFMVFVNDMESSFIPEFCDISISSPPDFNELFSFIDKNTGLNQDEF